MVEIDFPTSYLDGTVLPIQLGRLQLGLGDGPVVRILLRPDGIHIAVLESKFVHIGKESDFNGY
jgi:hypothetical protein